MREFWKVVEQEITNAAWQADMACQTVKALILRDKCLRGTAIEAASASWPDDYYFSGVGEVLEALKSASSRKEVEQVIFDFEFIPPDCPAHIGPRLPMWLYQKLLERVPD